MPQKHFVRPIVRIKLFSNEATGLFNPYGELSEIRDSSAETNRSFATLQYFFQFTETRSASRRHPIRIANLTLKIALEHNPRIIHTQYCDMVLLDTSVCKSLSDSNAPRTIESSRYDF